MFIGLVHSLTISQANPTPQRRAMWLKWGSIGPAALFIMSSSTQAMAHVKWFCDYDVAQQPRVLMQVLNIDFVALIVVALFALIGGYLLDQTLLGHAISRSLDRVTSLARTNTELIVRVTYCCFLICLWWIGGMILTPELKTNSTQVPILQLGMAALLTSRRTSALAGVGTVILFGTACRDYGLFHLLDYPIFLGIAAFLILPALPRQIRLPVQPLTLVRWSTAITLMWASIEKWAYPEWTLPIYASHPAMSMGYDFELFMQAAGVIEFTLAFALLWTPLVRRAAAFVLLGMFIGAIAEFGRLDAIGHSMIIAILVVLAADGERVGARAGLSLRSVTKPSLSYAIALLAVFSIYYGLHALMFGTVMV